LEGLQRAASRANQRRLAAGARSRRPSVFLSVSAGLVVGAAAAVLNRLEYDCAAVLRVAPIAAASDGRFETQSFHESVQRWISELPDASDRPLRFQVDSPQSGQLRLTLTSTDSRRGLAGAAAASERFLAEVAARRAEVRTTPGERELAFADWADRLRDRMAETEQEVRSGLTALPAADPRENRDRLLARWATLRAAFDESRASLAEARAELDRLENEPEPKRGLVTSQRRREAIQADAALVQDLRELEVKLAEVRLQLLLVWQNSASALEPLPRAVEPLAAALRSGSEANPDLKSTLEPFLAAVVKYRDSLAGFASKWNQEFLALRASEVDPFSGDLFDLHSRLRTLLNEWLFAASGCLTEMRNRQGESSAAGGAHARYFVFQSDLIRAFQAFQTAHHRFEFAAGTLDPRQNFRLEAALDSSRGLRRRSQHQIRQLDDRLEAEALVEAKQHRAEALTQARRNVEARRSQCDRSIEELTDLQDHLNRLMGTTEQFLSDKLRLEAAQTLMGLTERDYSQMQEEIRALAERRTTADPPRDELLSCAAAGSPNNLAQYLRTVGLATLFAALSVHFGQVWIARRG
jgi:hypothetical protein